MQVWIIAYARVVPYCEPAEALLWCFSIHMYWLSQMTPTTWLKRALLQLFLSFPFFFSLFFSFLSFVFCLLFSVFVKCVVYGSLHAWDWHAFFSLPSQSIQLGRRKALIVTGVLVCTQDCLIVNNEVMFAGNSHLWRLFFLSFLLSFFLFFSFLLSFVQNTSGAVMMSTSQAVSEPKWRKLVQNWKGPPAAAPSLLIPLF